MFKVGDKVVCTDYTFPAHQVLTVSVLGYENGQEMIGFKEHGHKSPCWLEERFRLVTPLKVFKKGDSLRCVDNNGVDNMLNIGEIYECKGMRSRYYVNLFID